VSDILLGAIISGLSLLFGYAIASYISYKTAKAQRETRLKELQQQLEHQKTEARRGRLVETRKTYLLPLRETVSKWVTELTRMIDQVDSLGRALRRTQEYPSSYLTDNSQKQVIDKIKDRMNTLKEDLEVLRGQVSDNKLSDAIDEVLFKELDVSIDSSPILDSTWYGWRSGKKDVKVVDDALNAIRIISVELRDHLQEVNKRIEELLIGEEAT